MALLVACCVYAGCQREPIYRETGQYAVRFTVDSESVLYMMPEKLELIQLSFYDIENDKEVYTTYMDADGGYLYSIRPGMYKLAAWTLNSDYTSVTYTNKYSLLTAEPKTVQETPMRVIVAPDHVFAYSSGTMEIPYIAEGDEDVVFTLPLKSVIDTWRIEVEGVEGLENFSDANFFVYNQARELYIGGWMCSGSAVDRSAGKVEGDLIVSEFGTFGMPEDEKVAVVARILAQNSLVHELTVDVTDQIRNPENKDHIIRICFDTKLNPLEQGGLLPTTEEWNEHTDHMDLI